MWKCPKCEREFKKDTQNHFCAVPCVTIQKYIDAQNQEQQPRLIEVYNAIKEVMPNAVEKISWQMPTFWQGGNLIHFAGAKNHIGIYPGGKATEIFAEKLKNYKTSKGGIRLPNNKPLDIELIKEIALWCKDNNSK